MARPPRLPWTEYPLIDVVRAAEVLAVSEQTIRNMCADGRLQAINVGTPRKTIRRILTASIINLIATSKY